MFVIGRGRYARATYPTARPTSSVLPNPTWSQLAWFIDPSNVTGLASDNNDGKTALTPVRTWNGGVIAKYGTYSPELAVSPTYTFLSGHTDDSDPVIFTPILINSQPIMTTALPAGTAGVLGAVTAVTRAAGSNAGLRAATLPAGSAAGDLIINHTRAESRSIVERSTGGAAFQLCQPFAAIDLTNLPSPENNAWNTGDSVTVFRMAQIAITYIVPIIVTTGNLNAKAFVIEKMAFFNDIALGTQPRTVLGANVQCFDIDNLRQTAMQGQAPSASLGCLYENMLIRSGLRGGPPISQNPDAGSGFMINGGACLSGTVFAIQNAQLDGGFIMGEGDGLVVNASLGEVAVDTGESLIVDGDSYIGVAIGWYSGGVVWGPGVLNSRGRLTYDAGAGVAAATFTVATLQINGSSSVESHSNVNATDVLHGQVALTAAALDAATGVAGFGGNAFRLSGGSITNGSL